MKITLATKITIARIILIFPTVALYIVSQMVDVSWNGYVTLTVLAAALLALVLATDIVDGMVARKTHTVSNLGKFLDPLADKVLVIAALACLLHQQTVNIVVFLLIVSREFMVSALRLVVAGKGTVVPAGFAGKLKTAFTMIALITAMVYRSFRLDFNAFGLAVPQVVFTGIEALLSVLFWIAAFLTVWSGAEYLVHYWKDINPNQ